MGLRRFGMATPGSLVQGRFSIHEPWLDIGSISWTFAQVRGEFHQLCHFTAMPGFSLTHSWAKAPIGLLPPWPLTISTRRKPERFTESRTSRASAIAVSCRRQTVPGKALK